jgi:tetratricopeptide (TPR) repeat protein
VKRPGLALLGALMLWPAAASAQAPPSPALASYVQGLDALRQGRYDEAAAALGRAVQAGPDPSFVLARGVAQCLGEKPREAIADFEQASGRDCARARPISGSTPRRW